jgi:ADP-ribose pyrophosphatase YjhB (NUDIX family)
VDAPPSRHYPSRPIVGVGAVIFIDGRILLVKRAHAPNAGTWSLPGGAVELGETAQGAAAREILEETGLVVDVGPVVDVVDRILVEEDGRVGYHFVVIDYVCQVRGGTLAAGSDVAAVALADPLALESFRLNEDVRTIIARARGTG